MSASEFLQIEYHSRDVASVSRAEKNKLANDELDCETRHDTTRQTHTRLFAGGRDPLVAAGETTLLYTLREYSTRHNKRRADGTYRTYTAVAAMVVAMVVVAAAAVVGGGSGNGGGVVVRRRSTLTDSVSPPIAIAYRRRLPLPLPAVRHVQERLEHVCVCARCMYIARARIYVRRNFISFAVIRSKLYK